MDIDPISQQSEEELTPDQGRVFSEVVELMMQSPSFNDGFEAEKKQQRVRDFLRSTARAIARYTGSSYDEFKQKLGMNGLSSEAAERFINAFSDQRSTSTS